MSETLRITRQAGMTMFRRPKLALPVMAAAAVGYVADLLNDAARKATVHRWLDGGGMGQSVLTETHSLASLSRGQMLALEIAMRGAFAAVGTICYAFALVATVRMMRRDGEVSTGVEWRKTLGLGGLIWLLGVATNAILVVLVSQLAGFVSSDAIRTVSVVGGVVMTAALFWILSPRAVRLAATQGGVLHPGSETQGQRIGVLTAVLTSLIAAINAVTAQFTYTHLDAAKVKWVSFGWLLAGTLPVVALVIGFGFLTSKEEGNQP